MINKNYKKYILLFLIILYILLISFLIKLYNQKDIEHFRSLEDNIVTLFNPSYKDTTEIKYYKDNSLVDNKNNKEKNKKETRYIHVIPLNNNKYLFYNKNKEYFMYLTHDMNDHYYKIKLFNVQNNIVGKLLVQESNKFIFKLDFISDDNYINIHFYNDYEEAKIFIDNDSEYFYIKLLKNQKFNKYNHKRNKEYEIYEYSKKIGKIDYNGKVVTYEEFKKYLTIFGLTYVLFDILR
jgi:hypothetical protein